MKIANYHPSIHPSTQSNLHTCTGVTQSTERLVPRKLMRQASLPSKYGKCDKCDVRFKSGTDILKYVTTRTKLNKWPNVTYNFLSGQTPRDQLT